VPDVTASHSRSGGVWQCRVRSALCAARAGSIVGNPLDSGYAAIASHQTYLRCLDLLLSDPGIDTLLVQGEIPRVNPPAREQALREIDALAAGRAGDRPCAQCR